MGKPILCLDFDGVLHSYESGWQGADVISDPPVPGAMVFLMNARPHFELHVFSSRSNQEGGIEAMQAWLLKHMRQEMSHAMFPDEGPVIDKKAERWVYEWIKWPTEKPPAMVTLDDRALTFTGVWPSPAELKAFRPWNKQ